MLLKREQFVNNFFLFFQLLKIFTVFKIYLRKNSIFDLPLMCVSGNFSFS